MQGTSPRARKSLGRDSKPELSIDNLASDLSSHAYLKVDQEFLLGQYPRIAQAKLAQSTMPFEWTLSRSIFVAKENDPTFLDNSLRSSSG